MNIIGIGPGDERLLTLAAKEALASAEVVYASARHAHLAPQSAKVLPLGEAAEGPRACVLLSGDTGIYSMLPSLAARFGKANLTVFPGVSALQMLCAKVKETWHDAQILSGHGRPLTQSALGYAARTNAKVILFCDAERDAKWIAGALTAQGMGDVQMIVGERLSYADERITCAAAREMADASRDPLCVVMLKNPRPEKGLPPVGLNDERFVRGGTPMTKREVRVQILAALGLPIDAVVWDVGAGTGSVSVECARQCPLGDVYAVERDADALALIQQNADQFMLKNLRVVSGSAPEILADLPAPTHVFIGGSGGEMDAIFDMIESHRAPVRVVTSAVTVQGEQGILSRMRGYPDFQMAQICVSRVEAAGQYHMRRAQNPVTIAAGTWEGRA